MNVGNSIRHNDSEYLDNLRLTVAFFFFFLFHFPSEMSGNILKEKDLCASCLGWKQKSEKTTPTLNILEREPEEYEWIEEYSLKLWVNRTKGEHREPVKV